jgi:endonuclease/exonuclease/phosphatase family metal-dependent hydrolase
MKINVMSQNVMSWECEPNGLFVNRRPLIKAAVLDNKADIIGFQEVRPNWAQWFETDLEGYESYLVYRGAQQQEGTPIYWNPEKVEKLDCGHFWLSETPEIESMGWDARCLRTALWALFRDKEENKEFVFVNTHLDHRGEQARINGIQLVCNFIKERFGNMPLILTGDFNAFPDSPTIQTANELLTDARTAFGIKEFEPTFHGFKQLKSVIDYVYISDNIKCTDFKTVIKTKDGSIQSDHYGLLAELEI